MKTSLRHLSFLYPQQNLPMNPPMMLSLFFIINYLLSQTDKLIRKYGSIKANKGLCRRQHDIFTSYATSRWDQITSQRPSIYFYKCKLLPASQISCPVRQLNSDWKTNFSHPVNILWCNPLWSTLHKQLQTVWPCELFIWRPHTVMEPVASFTAYKVKR